MTNAYTQARERLAAILERDGDRSVISQAETDDLRTVLAGPDREAMIDAAARAYFDTDFAPRAAAFNRRATPSYDEVMEHIRVGLRLKVTPLADAIRLLIGGGGE